MSVFCNLKLKANKPPLLDYPKELVTLGDHLKTKRLNDGLSQQSLGEQFGTSGITISSWELSKTNPTAEHLKNIIDYLGYDPFAPKAVSYTHLTLPTMMSV